MKKETGVVVPDIENPLDDPDEKGVPDLWNVPVLKAFKAWHYQMPDGTVYRHTEILDFKGVVDTMFSESIEGFYAYKVSAFNIVGESEKTLAKAVNSTIDLDSV